MIIISVAGLFRRGSGGQRLLIRNTCHIGFCLAKYLEHDEAFVSPSGNHFPVDRNKWFSVQLLIGCDSSC